MDNDVSEMDILPEYAFDYSAAKSNRFISPSMPNLDAYPFQIQPLAEDDGGGYLISFSDFSECISDGETIDEAIANGRDALTATIATLIEKGFPLPEPNSDATYSLIPKLPLENAVLEALLPEADIKPFSAKP